MKQQIQGILSKKIGILGGGISGLTTGFFLHKQHPDLDFQILDKNSSIRGGRACSFKKKIDNNIDFEFRFDPGANYLSFDSEEQKKKIFDELFNEKNPELLEGHEKIKTPVFMLDKDCKIEKSDQQSLRITYHNGLSQLSENLGKNIEDKITFNAEILTILKNKEGKWIVSYGNKEEEGKYNQKEFDVIISALHPLALQNILKNSIKGAENNYYQVDKAFSEAVNSIKEIKYKKQICAALDFQVKKSFLKEEKSNKFTQFSALLNKSQDSPISWVQIENEKPGHMPEEKDLVNLDYKHFGLTVQMSPEWSDKNYSQEEKNLKQKILDQVIKIFSQEENKGFLDEGLIKNHSDIFGNPENLKYSEIKKWEYATQQGQADLNEIVAKSENNSHIYFVGDITMPKSRVSNAFLSGFKIQDNIEEEEIKNSSK